MKYPDKDYYNDLLAEYPEFEKELRRCQKRCVWKMFLGRILWCVLVISILTGIFVGVKLFLDWLVEVAPIVVGLVVGVGLLSLFLYGIIAGIRDAWEDSKRECGIK